MKMTDLFLSQLEVEANLSRRALERVPEGRNDWKPHEKSTPLGYLAALVASMPAWIILTVNQDAFDLAGPDNGTFRPKEWRTKSELLAMLDANVAKAREALAKTTDEDLMKTWKFLINGQVVQQQPRYEMLFSGVFCHMAHHRGQLTVYLRLNDAPVPALYGPSADEGKAG
jgi:uncharacterized damage-inducible protein DinB